MEEGELNTHSEFVLDLGANTLEVDFGIQKLNDECSVTIAHQGNQHIAPNHDTSSQLSHHLLPGNEKT